MVAGLHALRAVQRAAARRAELAAIPTPPADPDIRPEGLPFLDTFDLPIELAAPEADGSYGDFLSVLQAIIPCLEGVGA